MTVDQSSNNTESNTKTSTGAEIRLENVRKQYGADDSDMAAVEDLSLVIPAGEIVMFVGPSGCGKTTSLKMINRLIDPTSGTITIDGEDIRTKNADQLRRTIGYVIQGGSLFPHMTVADNIALVPGLLKWDKQRTAKRVDELLDLVGLEPSRYRHRYPRELSGGQQQRVGVARGLAADPPVILMDEPFGAVDPITRQRLQDELLNIQAELKKTIVCVTHDIDEAVKLGDRILILQESARIAQYDPPPTILSAPANEFVEDFVGSGSALKQLSLTRVGDIKTHPNVTAAVGDAVSEVKARAAANGDDTVVILDDRRRPIGWVFLNKLQGPTIERPRDAAELLAVDTRATLNDALDTMLTSSYGGAIVTSKGDEYLSIVSFDTVTNYIHETNRRLAEVGEEELR